MIRQRIYNPAQLTPDELKASFIARHETLARLLRLLAEQKPGHPCQHVILVGPRGMGKTTLGLSLLQAVREDRELASNWQPVPFHEESYDIGDLADFWLAALRHLTRATGERRWGDRADQLWQDEDNAERLAVYAMAELLDFCDERRKRLILFVENLDLIFGQLRNEREIHALRAALIEHDEILLVGSANTVFDAIRSYGEPFYEFFRLIALRGLDRGECRLLLETLARRDAELPDPAPLDFDEGRLETIRHLTGGNPRLLVLGCRMLLGSPLGSAIEDLEQLMDEQTPYFKARIETLPVQARRVFHCLAEAWSPLLAREVAARAKLSSSHASAQLRQLTDKGYVREVRRSEEKRSRYEVGDRFYNLYYLMRFSRPGRARLERLIDFLHQLFGPVGMRRTYAAALEALRTEGFSAEDLSDWLKVLAGRVAMDDEYPERLVWLEAAIGLAAEKLGPNAPVRGELADIVAGARWGQPDMARVLYRAVGDMLTGDAKEAEAAFRDILATAPDGKLLLQGPLGFTLYRQGRFDAALTAFRQAAMHGGSGDERFDAGFRGLVMLGEVYALLRLDKAETAITVVERALTLDRPGDPAWRFAHGTALLGLGEEFASLGRKDCAMRAWSRVAELVESDDPPEILRLRMSADTRRGALLLQQRKSGEVLAILDAAQDSTGSDNSALCRHHAMAALVLKAVACSDQGRRDDAVAMLRRISDYVRSDDPERMRHSASQALANASDAFGVVGHAEAAEMAAREATKANPGCANAWCALAEVLLNREGRAPLAEAERCARRAVELAPKREDALLTLYAVLKRRNKAKEARELLTRVPDAEMAASQRQGRRWVGVMISLIADGHAALVKQMLADMDATGTLEPLWHAARAELGEDLGPLPSEVMDAVEEVRRRVAQERK